MCIYIIHIMYIYIYLYTYVCVFSIWNYIKQANKTVSGLIPQGIGQSSVPAIIAHWNAWDFRALSCLGRLGRLGCLGRLGQGEYNKKSTISLKTLRSTLPGAHAALHRYPSVPQVSHTAEPGAVLSCSVLRKMSRHVNIVQRSVQLTAFQ